MRSILMKLPDPHSSKGVNDIRRDISGPVISVIFNTQDSVTSRCRASENIHFIASCRCRGQKAITEPDFYTVVCENKVL